MTSCHACREGGNLHVASRYKLLLISQETSVNLHIILALTYFWSALCLHKARYMRGLETEPIPARIHIFAIQTCRITRVCFLAYMVNKITNQKKLKAGIRSWRKSGAFYVFQGFITLIRFDKSQFETDVSWTVEEIKQFYWIWQNRCEILSFGFRIFSIFICFKNKG
jgi:hypothetical protein